MNEKRILTEGNGTGWENICSEMKIEWRRNRGKCIKNKDMKGDQSAQKLCTPLLTND
jgi:hypothetical protein